MGSHRREVDTAFGGRTRRNTTTPTTSRIAAAIRLPRMSIIASIGANFIDLGSANGRFLRHRFSPKPKVIATLFSLPKIDHVAKEAVSAAWQTRTRQRSERICKPNDAPKTKPRLCVKTMLCDPTRIGRARRQERFAFGKPSRRRHRVRYDSTYAIRRTARGACQQSWNHQ